MQNNIQHYDVIVVGGGHAGVEAAHAAATMGSKTVLVTLSKDKIGYMPCNPAIGGIGKGHIVFEISALGGLMPQLCSTTYLQAHMLNTKKGPAVHGLRLQIDKVAYAKAAKKALGSKENLTIREAMVEELQRDAQGVITGVTLNDGTLLVAPSVVLTTGTFLNGLVHVGLTNYPSGRETEASVTTLAQSIKNLGLEMGRLKTGTPPRLAAESLNYAVMEKQEIEPLDFLFEFEPIIVKNSHACYITHTNETVHDIIKNNADKSPILRKEITGTGPRYCPSIEDKVTRFPDKTAHQVFVEPESASTNWVYPNGLSTSLPLEAQEQYIRAIKGFENATIVRAGYAIEYDIIMPHQLKKSLEVKAVPGLFLAGQINGTTGYEEAAGQGIMAGINAHLKAHNKEAFILDRHESYIGVMIDDLTTLSIDEPYRMFTSRAERRLLLRQDNAFLRLTDKAYTLGMISEHMYKKYTQEKKLLVLILEKLKATLPLTQLLDLFTENEKVSEKIESTIGISVHGRLAQTVLATIKYEPYLVREEREIERIRKYQTLRLPNSFDYHTMDGLSKELRQKLSKHRPETIAAASLIPGITPAALSFLILKLSLAQKEQQKVQ